jgi:hypothetical protein
MNMSVQHRLARDLPHVDPDVVPLRSMRRLDPAAHPPEEFEHRRNLRWVEVKEVSDVAPGHDQGVPGDTG